MNAKEILLVLFLAMPGAHSAARILAVVNAASYRPSLPLGGGLATVFCTGISDGTNPKPGLFVAPSGAPLPYELDGISIRVNGGYAPILSVYIPAAGQPASEQINFQVPLERNVTYFNNYDAGVLPDNGTLQILLAPPVRGGEVPNPLTPLPSPGIGGFYADANGYAVAQHASDYSQVTTENPAHPGETIIAYADDFYQVWPSPPVGYLTPLLPLFQYSSVIFNASIDLHPGFLFLQTYPSPDGHGYSFADTPALTITFQGLAPGLVGVEQINFVVPANQPPGHWALFFNLGTSADGKTHGNAGGYSHPYVTLPVR